MNPTTSTSVSERELVIERLFNAPRELVFKVWTQPEHVANWWGPSGFTITMHEMDAKLGGVWRFDMVGPDGTVYPNKITYEEIIQPERLVFAYGTGLENDPEQFQVTVTFEAKEEKTAITMRMLFPDKAQKDKAIKEYGAIEGNTQTLDKLELHLAELVYSASEHAIISSRLLKHSAEEVYEVFQNPDLLRKWWGPKGFSNTFSRFEFVPGGVWEFIMHGPNGVSYPNKSVFYELEKNKRIVYDHMLGHPFRMVITLETEEAGTKITWKMIHATAKQMDSVKHFVVPANEENLDRLEQLLLTAQAPPHTDGQSFAIERVLQAPVEKVWSAITSKEEMKKWYFDLVEFIPETGFRFAFTGKGTDGVTEYVHLCEVTQVIPFKKLAYTWKYEKYEGNSTVTFELIAQRALTLLKLTHTGLGSFPNLPDFAPQNFAEGWTYIIGKSLVPYLHTTQE